MSTAPVRFTSGFTQNAPWQMVAQMGQPDPAFYNTFFNDFDVRYPSTNFTTTATGNGAITAIAGDGGILQWTTNTSTPLATDLVSIQTVVANFSLVPGNGPHKTFFTTRISLSDVTNAAFITGLMAITATPFTGTPDGIYFSKASGSTTINLIHVFSGVSTSVAIPTAAITLANNTYVDLGFYSDGKLNIYAFAGNNFEGYLPQSGTGATTQNKGPVASMVVPALTTTLLSATHALQSGTASSKTMNADWVLAARER